MDNYFKIRNQLKAIQEDLNMRLERVVKEKGYDETLAWFDFHQDSFIIHWMGHRLPMELLRAFEEEFGEIKEIHTTTISHNFNIWFKKEDE